MIRSSHTRTAAGVASWPLSPARTGYADNLLANGTFEKDSINGTVCGPASRMPAGRPFILKCATEDARRSASSSTAKPLELQRLLRLEVTPGEIFESKPAGVWAKGEGERRPRRRHFRRRRQDAELGPWRWFGPLRTKGLLAAPLPLRHPSRRCLDHFCVSRGTSPPRCGSTTSPWSARGRWMPSGKKDLPGSLSVENTVLRVTCHTADASFTIRDRRVGREFRQGASEGPLVSTQSRPAGVSIFASSTRPRCARRPRPSGSTPTGPSASWRSGARERWNCRSPGPAPFATVRGQVLILPVNEGISYPVDDASLPEMHYHLYGRSRALHAAGTARWTASGVWMAIVESPDDAGVRIPLRDGLLCLVPRVAAPEGRLSGRERVIRYVFLDRGGYVAMAKRYREYARKTGLFRTLAENRKANPNVDLLVGAVNIWCWGGTPRCLVPRTRGGLGMHRILWSNRSEPDQLKTLNELAPLDQPVRHLPGRDGPEELPALSRTSPRLDRRGVGRRPHHDRRRRRLGPRLAGHGEGRRDDPVLVFSATARPWRMPSGASPSELKTHPYRCRFIDTTTASPCRECYHSKHPMTRTESKRFKMECILLLRQRGLWPGLRQRDRPRRRRPVCPRLRRHAQPWPLSPPRRRAGHGGDLVTRFRSTVSFRPGPATGCRFGSRPSRVRRLALVLGRLQQQGAEALGPPGPLECPLRHAADVHVRPEDLGSPSGPLRPKLQGRNPGCPGHGLHHGPAMNG